MSISCIELLLTVLMITAVWALPSESSHNQSKLYACVVGMYEYGLEVDQQTHFCQNDSLQNCRNSYYKKVTKGECLIDQQSNEELASSQLFTNKNNCQQHCVQNTSNKLTNQNVVGNSDKFERQLDASLVSSILLNENFEVRLGFILFLIVLVFLIIL